MTNAEIQVGEYVRTKTGHIGKFQGEPKEDVICSYDGFGNIKCFIKEIKSHSFNLIELIEVGDYVNGSKVYDVQKIASNNYEQSWILLSNYDRDAILSKQIKTIVTKEQFKSMEYKVGDDEV